MFNGAPFLCDCRHMSFHEFEALGGSQDEAAEAFDDISKSKFKGLGSDTTLPGCGERVCDEQFVNSRSTIYNSKLALLETLSVNWKRFLEMNSCTVKYVCKVRTLVSEAHFIVLQSYVTVDVVSEMFSTHMVLLLRCLAGLFLCSIFQTKQATMRLARLHS